MENEQLIELMRAVIKEELTPINKHLASLDDRMGILEVKSDMTHRKIDNIEFAVKVLERELKKDIRLLKDGQETLIAVLEAKDILPKAEGQ